MPIDKAAPAHAGMFWFIVSGRCWGADEAVSHVYRVASKADAIASFKFDLRNDDEEEPEDGPGHVYIDSVFRCATQPEEC